MSRDDKNEITRTEIVESENILLGREHVRFLEETIKKIQASSQYKASKSQIIRALIEGAMKRKLRYDGIRSELDMKQRLLPDDDGEATFISRKP